MNMVDLNIVLGDGILHHGSNLFFAADSRVDHLAGSCLAARVTSRASTIACALLFRKHAVPKSGQTCLTHFWARNRTSSRPALANATASPASTLGANPGNAITDAASPANIAKAARDLIMLCCGLG